VIRRDRLRMLMSTHRVTQRALAAELGISAQTIGKILIGAPVDMRKLPIIARMFRVSQEYLLGETDDPSISAMEAAIDKEEGWPSRKSCAPWRRPEKPACRAFRNARPNHSRGRASAMV